MFVNCPLPLSNIQWDAPNFKLSYMENYKAKRRGKNCLSVSKDVNEDIPFKSNDRRFSFETVCCVGGTEMRA